MIIWLEGYFLHCHDVPGLIVDGGVYLPKGSLPYAVKFEKITNMDILTYFDSSLPGKSDKSGFDDHSALWLCQIKNLTCKEGNYD